jgi:hypothetical protein
MAHSPSPASLPSGVNILCSDYVRGIRNGLEDGRRYAVGDRARRGARGALNPKPSSRGAEFPVRGANGAGAYRPEAGKAMLTTGSCAAEPHETGQVRKEAAISGSFRVPQGHPI